jgi:hypothetical protein
MSRARACRRTRSSWPNAWPALEGSSRRRRPRCACSEVVYHQANPVCVRVEIVCEVAHHFGELHLSAMLGHLRFSVALERLEGHEHVSRTLPLVFGVEAFRLPGLHRQRISHLGQQLAGSLVEANDRAFRIVRLFVEVQDCFHPPHECGVLLGRDHPLLDEVRAKFVFLSVLRTVSCETDSTMPSSIALSARSLKLQRSHPLGGSEQARAIRRASARP